MRLARKYGAKGFSIIELVLAMAVAVILLAISLPAFLRAYRIYELNNAARQMADILRLTRYEAIRLNTTVNCVIQAGAGTTSVWVDSSTPINNGTLDPTEKMILLDSSGVLTSPPSSTVPISSQIGTNSVVTPSPSSSTVTFDARGAVKPPTNVNVFYLQSPLAQDAGYRAVVLMPAGSIQVWMSDVSGNWQVQQ